MYPQRISVSAIHGKYTGTGGQHHQRIALLRRNIYNIGVGQFMFPRLRNSWMNGQVQGGRRQPAASCISSNYVLRSLHFRPPLACLRVCLSVPCMLLLPSDPCSLALHRGRRRCVQFCLCPMQRATDRCSTCSRERGDPPHPWESSSRAAMCSPVR